MAEGRAERGREDAESAKPGLKAEGPSLEAKGAVLTVADAHAAAGAAAAAVAGNRGSRLSAPAVLSLQRRAGNHAVRTMMARSAGTVATVDAQRKTDLADPPTTTSDEGSAPTLDLPPKESAPPAPGAPGAPGPPGSGAPGAPASPGAGGGDAGPGAPAGTGTGTGSGGPAPPAAPAKPPPPPPAPPSKPSGEKPPPPPPRAARREAAGGPPAGTPGKPQPAAPATTTGTTTPPPVVAPPAPTRPAGGPGAPATPAATTADPNVNWQEVAGILIPPARTALEVSRFIPGWGALAGIASDTMGAYSDLSSVPNNDTGELVSDLIYVRSGITIVNGALGHVLYVNQLIQDGLAGSIIGAEFTPLTAGVNETLSTVKIFLDVGNGMVDVLVEAGAMYGRDHATTPTEAAAWNGLVDGYAANIAGDVVGLIMDSISLASLGAANTGPAQETVRIFNTAGAILKSWGPNLISLLGGIWNVWGAEIIKWLGLGSTGGPTTAPATGGAPPTSGPPAAPGGPPVQRLGGSGGGGQMSGSSRLMAESVALDAAGALIDLNAPQAQAAYAGVNGVIDLMAAYMADKMKEIDQVVMAIGDGRSSFQLIRDAVAQSIDVLNGKLSSVTELVAIAGNAVALSEQVRAYCDDATASIDAIQMPVVQIPEVDLGEGMLADAGEYLANEAAALANEQLAAIVASVAESLATGKDGLKTPIADIRARSEAIGEFLENVIQIGTEQMGVVSGHLATFSQGLAKCENVEQVINLMIGQISSITGLPQFTVQDLRDLWTGVGTAIDQFAALGPQLHQSAAIARRQAAQALAEEEAANAQRMVAPGAADPADDDTEA